ncbi:hypothetical protein QF032_000019 [Streptomyces achromogenes]|uniref:hypothetical protein n=1 Tax=Streptomyces achromogenes TaxID=67255 RepID=UPI00278932BA|nr:hypothetical protein [Streptomyces achromogenes]MDQ0828175.1 hypothetical protein [Streptomyces achromogenes]
MKRKIASIAVVAALAVGGVAACGDGDSSNHSTPKTPNSSTPRVPSPSIPRLAIGQTLHISTSPAQMARPIPAGAADVALLNLDVTMTYRSKDTRTVDKADPGEQFVIWTIKVTNTGPDEFDLYPLTAAQRWTSGGQVTAPGLFLGLDDDLGGKPDPRPGETVTGSSGAVVPEGSGVLEFSDRQGVPMFAVVVSK